MFIRAIQEPVFSVANIEGGGNGHDYGNFIFGSFMRNPAIYQVSISQLFYTYFYNHAHRPHLEKLLYLGLSRTPSGFFNPLLDPGNRGDSETAARPLRNRGRFRSEAVTNL